MLLNMFAVGCGGFIGAVCRYLCTTLTNKIAYLTVNAPSFGFPIGILAINFVGCFLMGFLAMWLPARFPGNARLLAFVTTGCLGGFTTMSTFCLDSWKLLAGGDYLLGVLNIVLTLVLCMLGVVAGVACAKAVS